MSPQGSRIKLSSPGSRPAWVLRFLALGKMSCDFQAFHQTFFDESKELLDSALAIVAEGVRTSLAGEQLAELHRCVHGIAGGAATLGFDQPAFLAKAIETRLERFRTGGDKPDPVTLGRCGDALGLLDKLLVCLRCGEAPPSDQIDVMITRLGSGIEASAVERSGGDAGDVRTIRFVLSRSLAGADIIIEHVLADLGRHGDVLELEPPQEGGERAWSIKMTGGLPDSSVADVLNQIAEPGSLQITCAPARKADAEPPNVFEPERMSPSSQSDPAVTASDVTGRPSNRSPATGDEAGAGAEEHVSFWVGDQMFVIAASHLLGIEAYRGELRMPGLPAVLLGMFVVNGEVLPLVDAHRALGIDESGVNPDELAPVLLIDTCAGPIGLLADREGERLKLRIAQLRRPRALRGLLAGSPVTGFFVLGDQVGGFLDPDRLSTFLEGFALELRALDVSDTEALLAPDGRKSDRTMVQARRGSAIMTSSTVSRAPVRRVAARPVARRSLEEEWKQRDP